MTKSGWIGVLAVATLLLSGCAADDSSQQSSRIASSAEGSTSGSSADEIEAGEISESPAENVPAPAGPGEVCDPQNLNDSICAAFYPEQLVLNLTSAPRASEPLASMSDHEKFAIAKQACAAYREGQTHSTTSLAEGDRNNRLVFTAGALAYCTEYADASTQGFIAYYRELGEEGAKADFADKTMPKL